MCTCITFCWIRQLFNTTLTGPVAFGGQELCVIVLHSAVSHSYLTLVYWSHDTWKTRVMCTYITCCCIRQLFKNALTGPVAFGGWELCVFILHSAGPDSYLTLL
jgi:hypothetical protein